MLFSRIPSGKNVKDSTAIPITSIYLCGNCIKGFN